MGYEFVEMGERNPEGFFRPSVRSHETGNLSRNISVMFYESAKQVVIQDFAEKIHESIVLNLDGTITDEINNELKEAMGKRQAEGREERQKLFQEKFDKIERSDAKTNSLLEKKKLRLFGTAFIAKEFSFGKGRPLKTPLIVPFYDNTNKKLCGAQVCFLDHKGKSKEILYQRV